MEPSIFFKHRERELEGFPAVPMLLIEVLASMQEEIQDMETLPAMQLAACRAGLVTNPEDLGELQALYLLQRMQPPEGKAESEEPPPAKRGSKRAFGTEFLSRFENLTLPEKCLYASGYNFEEARLLYCVYDKDIASEVIRHKLENDMAKSQMDFEAVVFGMGGSFGKSSGASKELGEVTDFAKAQAGEDGYVESAMAFMNMQHSFRRK